MKEIERFVPWVVAALAGFYLWFATRSAPEADQKMHLNELAKLPVMAEGRVQPLGTVARNSLLTISNRQTFVDKAGKKQPAIKWLLDVMTYRFAQRDDVFKYKVFRIENDEVLNLLDLERRPGSYRYALDEFSGKMDRLEKEFQRAGKVDAKNQNVFDAKILHLGKQLQLYIKLSQLEEPLLVPPHSKGEGWKSLRQAVSDGRLGGPINPGLLALAKIIKAFGDDEPASFNQGVVSYRKLLSQEVPGAVDRAQFEESFNAFNPFYHCAVLYVMAFLISCCSWLVWRVPLSRAAFWLMITTLVIHTWALGARMYMMDRPFVFVTNLYSSAVFIGWGCVVLGLILEAIFHNSIGNVVASAPGAATVWLSIYLAGKGDTMRQLQAVLDTDFWLATHVTCVTIGYMATFVAGCLGIVYILLGVATPVLDKSLAKTLGQMIYGIVCFATLFSFTGTVLGGIWADQSWGRFWGWDPKENGALLIVLMNALILHARWGGMVKQRGMAVLAVVGNMVTGWSWFGTNQLGVGLHAYGFNNTLAFGLVVLWAVHLGIIIMGCLPMKRWWSYAALNQPAPRSIPEQ